MKFSRFGFGAIYLIALAIGGCLYVGSIAIRSLDPFPTLEFFETTRQQFGAIVRAQDAPGQHIV